MNLMETIGIIAAMPQESAAVLRLVQGSKRSALGRFRCWRFRLVERDCWLVTSGIGIDRAAEATRALVEASRPQLLASVGTAGAVNSGLEIGDVVNAKNTCLLDMGMQPIQFRPLAMLSNAAREAAVLALQSRRAHLFPGTAVTTRGYQYVKDQPDEMINPVLEMETDGIVRVAAEYGISLLSLRSISDGPAAPIPLDPAEVMDEQYNLRIGGIIKAVLRHPQMVTPFLQMGRYTNLAARNAAIALIAALNQPEPVVVPAQVNPAGRY
jgi:adenosylhomocysteine nucleosidase